MFVSSTYHPGRAVDDDHGDMRVFDGPSAKRRSVPHLAEQIAAFISPCFGARLGPSPATPPPTPSLRFCYGGVGVRRRRALVNTRTNLRHMLLHPPTHALLHPPPSPHRPSGLSFATARHGGPLTVPGKLAPICQWTEGQELIGVKCPRGCRSFSKSAGANFRPRSGPPTLPSWLGVRES